MEPKLYCVKIPSSGLPLHVSVECLIRALVLCSMLLQVFLVFGGGFRYRSSKPVLRFFVWLAYMSADVVAISALGIMTHSAQNQIYGVWAPMLLLHLGGLDTITAYSIADNELWIRHGLLMLYQVSMATYVVYLSSLKGYMLASAVLLFIAGATKYGERTLALRYASYSQVVSSTLPVYKFMQHEDEIDKEIDKVDYNYLVMGEDRFEENLKEKQQKDTKLRNENQNSSLQEQEGVRRRIENQNSSSERREGGKRTNDSWNSLLKSCEIVTIKNVWYQEGLQTTDNYILCLSHALFKMYKRRFVSLYFHECIRQKTRKFFINERLKCENLFKIVEMELKFMYDVLFSKSIGTAFSMTGTLLRLLNTCFIAAAGILLYTGANEKPAKKIVTYVLISVGLAVEVIQLCRIAVSDWTMVRLVCAYIQQFRRPSHRCWFMFKIIRLAISLLGTARKACGDKYWKKSITQYSVIDACSSKWHGIWQWSQSFQKISHLIVPLFIKTFHMKEKPVKDVHDFRGFIFEKLKVACSPDQEIETCRERVYAYDEYLVTMDCEDLQWASDLDMEDLILTWHIATTICEKAPSLGTAGAFGSDSATVAPPATAPSIATSVVGGGATGVPPPTGFAAAAHDPPASSSTTASPLAASDPVGGTATADGAGGGSLNQNISMILSRYCAYLLVSHPNLLPLHADIAKLSYVELHHELVPLLKEGYQEWKWMEYQGNNTILGFGTQLARDLLRRSQQEMWKIMSEYWAGLLIYLAVYNKASLHAECLTCGGEFLSQIWVLLGHMGCGEQSDTAVTKKKEVKSRKEKEEEEKKRRREEESSKEYEEKRLRDEGKNARKQEMLDARKEEENN